MKVFARIWLLLLATCCMATSAMAQDVIVQPVQYSTGLRYDAEAMSRVKSTATLMTRDYVILPSSHSLRQYCPDVGNQREFGTCVSWASTYAARTIAEAVRYGWTDREKINQEAFSPLFVYAQIKDWDDYECQNGAVITQAMDQLKKDGAPKKNSFDVFCAERVTSDLKSEASNYKINSYNCLIRSLQGGKENKIRMMKKALAEDHPVVICMYVYKSFCSCREAIWNGNIAQGEPSEYHAMCVVGYDDSVGGTGAFQIMNSWGPEWGEDGFVWVRYDDFCKTVDYAVDMYVPKSNNIVTPAVEDVTEPEKAEVRTPLSGELELVMKTGEKMQVALCRDRAVAYYRVQEDLMSRDRYRVFISNNEPAYVYMIASDLTNEVTKLFPDNENVSAQLTYKSSHVAIPDESNAIELDDRAGTDYMCVLYSREELDIDSIADEIKYASGTFYDKVSKVLGDKMARNVDVRYTDRSIRFEASTDRVLVPIVVELSHQAQ